MSSENWSFDFSDLFNIVLSFYKILFQSDFCGGFRVGVVEVGGELFNISRVNMSGSDGDLLLEFFFGIEVEERSVYGLKGKRGFISFEENESSVLFNHAYRLKGGSFGYFFDYESVMVGLGGGGSFKNCVYLSPLMVLSGDYHGSEVFRAVEVINMGNTIIPGEVILVCKVTRD